MLAGSIKKRQTLEKMCSMIHAKNYKLYLEHELMLDEEKQKRAALQEDFQTQMEQINNEINSKKEERQRDYDANNEVRKEIKTEVDDYRKHEAEYKEKLAEHQARMAALEG